MKSVKSGKRTFGPSIESGTSRVEDFLIILVTKIVKKKRFLYLHIPVTSYEEVNCKDLTVIN